MARFADQKEKILFYLADKRDFVTADELANYINISTISVYRLIKKINQQDEIIYSERGRGYQLNRDENQSDTSSNYLKSNFKDKDQRRYEIIQKLLLKAPAKIRIEELYNQYFISMSSIAADIKFITQFLNEYHIFLHHDKQVLFAEGKESDIRHILNRLWLEQNEFDLSQKAFEISGEIINKYDARFIISQMQWIEKNLQAELMYPYNESIFSHLYILLNRVRLAGSTIENLELTQDIRIIMDHQPDIKFVSNHVIKSISQYLNVKLPDVEAYYLFQYIISSRIESETNQIANMSSNVSAITGEIIRAMKSTLPKSVDLDMLFSKVIRHIEPMLHRIENDIQNHNRLLTQIQLAYPDIFYDLKRVVNRILNNHGYNGVSDDEIGFITLYFAQTVEQKRDDVNAIIVCTTGIGTSELLRVKVEKNFSNINVIDVVASNDIKGVINNPAQKVDLIISTVLPTEEVDVPVLPVSAMFTLDDKVRLEHALEDIQRG